MTLCDWKTLHWLCHIAFGIRRFQYLSVYNIHTCIILAKYKNSVLGLEDNILGIYGTAKFQYSSVFSKIYFQQDKRTGTYWENIKR